MPLDTLPPLHRLSKRLRRIVRSRGARRPVPTALQAIAQERRAALFVGSDEQAAEFANLATMRRRGLVPFERRLLPVMRENLAALSTMSGKVWP